MKTNTYKGIVVKVTADVIVLLCDGGQFKNVPRGKNEVPKIGQAYTYIEKQNRRFPNLTKYLTLASGLFIAIFGYLILTHMKPDEAYLFAVDINPSIEIYTDEQLNVVDIHYLNEDGKILINELKYKNEHVNIVVDKVIDIAVKKKYLTKNEEGIVALTVVPLKKERHINNIEIRANVEQALKTNDITADISISNGNKKLLEKAHEKKLSINKYQLYKDLKKNNIHINLDELKEKPMRVVMNETGYLLGQKQQQKQVNKENDNGNLDNNTEVLPEKKEKEHSIEDGLIEGQKSYKNEKSENINAEKEQINELKNPENSKSTDSTKKEHNFTDDDDDREKELAELEQKKLEEKKKEQEKAEKEQEKAEQEKQEKLEKKKKAQDKAEKEREKEEQEQRRDDDDD